MKKIVREYQKVVTEYLVECESNEDAITKVDNLDSSIIEVNVSPEFICTLGVEVRNITSKDMEDPVFKKALSKLEDEKDRIKISDIDVLLEMCRD